MSLTDVALDSADVEKYLRKDEFDELGLRRLELANIELSMLSLMGETTCLDSEIALQDLLINCIGEIFNQSVFWSDFKERG